MNKKLVTALTTLVVAAGAYVYTGADLPFAQSDTPTTEAAPTPGGADLSKLTVAPEDTGAHYDREDWPHWSSVGEGCDARDAALKAHGRGVTVGDDCDVSGEWTSIYDGETVTDASELDVDHWVPLAEVARSGARDWTENEREAYANDPDVLVPVTASSNRSKGDQDPATWLPEQDRCGYVTTWVQIKQRYELTVDRAEHEALASVLKRC